VATLNSKALLLKLFLKRIVKYLQYVLAFGAVACAGFFLGEQGLTQKQKLEEKAAILRKDNDRVAREIKALERRVNLLRSDSKTIEKVSKRKLGMVRTDETVYVFQKAGVADSGSAISEHGLAKDGNMP
jgi:cell division protein FtsB